MTDQFRALCAELVDDLELCDWPYKLKGTIRADIERARALLAEADGPAVPDGREPASVALQPSDGEVAEVAAWLRLFCSEEYESRSHDPDVAWLTRAAALLEQHHPAPPGEERIGNWLLPEKPPLPEHWSGDLEYGFETAWETARALLQQHHPASVPLIELPQGWHMLSDIEPEPGAMCDWVIMAPWGCDHGSGKWRDYNGVSPCEAFDVPVDWPVSVCYKGFASAGSVMVSDPKLTAWRMLPLPTMAAEARL